MGGIVHTSSELFPSEPALNLADPKRAPSRGGVVITETRNTNGKEEGMQGMTLKQMAVKQFFNAIDDYKDARKNGGRGMVEASVRIHTLKASVPKKYWRLASYSRLCAE